MIPETRKKILINAINTLIFEHTKIITFDNKDYVDIFDIGINIGLSRWNGKSYDENGNRKESPYKSKILSIAEKAKIVPIVLKGSSYITIEDAYRFVYYANTTTSNYIYKLTYCYMFEADFKDAPTVEEIKKI